VLSAVFSPQGAAMIRTKGEAGTGNVVEAVRHSRTVLGEIRKLSTMDDDEIYVYAKEIGAPVELVRQTKSLGRLPVVNFAAGGVATPADAALMMQLGCDGVFVGSGIFKSGDPAKRARAIVQAVTHYNDPKVLAEVSCDLGEPMVGLECKGANFVACACPCLPCPTCHAPADPSLSCVTMFQTAHGTTAKCDSWVGNRHFLWTIYVVARNTHAHAVSPHMVFARTPTSSLCALESSK